MAVGGTSLGSAVGRITIDISDLQNVRVTTQQVGQEVERNLGRIGTGAKKAQDGLAELGRAAQQLAGPLGISLGAAGIVQLGRFAIEAEKVATAYDRQRIAAVSLAGSQAQLNDLLAAYDRATGGAIDRATALADVTRLQAVGFADSARELEQFATVARGISIATGQQQDYVISQLQLAIANQSTLRLDQLGLGVGEVKQRIDELKAANKGMTDEMAYQQAILGLADKKFGDLATSSEGAATGLEQASKAWKDLRLAIGEATQGPLDAFGQSLAIFIDIQTARLRAWTSELDVYIRLLRQVGMAGPWLTTSEQSFVSGSAARDRGRHRGPASSTAPVVETINQELLDAQREYAREVFSIERESAQRRIDATRQYGQQRAEAVRSYELGIARDAEDFARNRQRQAQQLAQAILDIQEDAARREADQAEELARTIAQARADSADRLADMEERLARTISEARANSAERVADWEEDRLERVEELRGASADRIAKLEADYAKERERAAQDHSDKLANAAGRLDAIAIAAEQRRWARENEEREEGHTEQLTEEQEKLQEQLDQLNEAHAERLADEQEALDKSIRQANEAHARQVADEQKALAKRIAQAQEAYNRQLADAREADERRIAEMIEAQAEQQRLEDEDRAIRLQRQAADHQAQLASMAAAHSAQMAEIDRAEAEQLQSAKDALDEELAEQGLFNIEYLRKQKAFYEDVDDLLEEYMKTWKTTMEDAIKAAGMLTFNTLPPSAYPGIGNPYGALNNYGPSTYVMPSANVTAPSGGNSYNVDNISVSVTGTTSMNQNDLREAVRQGIVDALEEAAA